MKLFIEATAKTILGFIIMNLLIFLSAGTFSFPNGWILNVILFIPMFISGVVMLFKTPELLKLRLAKKETQKEQSLVIKLSGLMFTLGFIVAGLDFRFNLSRVPKSIVICACVVFLSGYLLYGEVIRENVYLSRTIQVHQNQKVINTGLYRIVRHPMYFATLLLFLSVPIILGSFYSFVIFLTYPFILTARIHFEEAFLENNLEGYTLYRKKVKYRLIPFIW